MRSILLASLAAIAIPACTQDIAGGPSGGDDGPTCGNGVVDPGEACDDGNTNNGDGCSSSCTTENTNTPRVSLSVDLPTVTSNLNVDNMVTITATSMMGYAGTVTLTAAADSNGTPITDWGATFDNATLTLTAGGTATAKVDIKAMGDTAMLAGNMKITATGAPSPVDVSVAATFNPTLTVKFGDSAGTCVYDTDHFVANPFNLKAGRSIEVINGSATLPFTVHVGPTLSGFTHEGGKTAAGGSYMGTSNATDIGTTAQFYCHNDGANPVDTVVDKSNGASHQFVIVVQ